ncbi:MAG: ABC transporter permease [Pseudomonadota bacterium]
MTINQRRWANFKANRRGYWSMWIFLGLFSISLFAELIANDKPIVLSYEGGLHFPVFKRYPETVFGGELPIEANYRDPYVQALIKDSGGWMIWPLIPYKYDTIDYYIEGSVPAAPSSAHWLGTDDGAKDVLSRLIYGFRLSVLFGFAMTILSAMIGITIGALQGYFGGYIDLIGQRLVEIWSGLPILFLLIILGSIIEPNAVWLLLVLVLFNWMFLVGVVRAEFLRTRNFEFVRAARALGVSDRVIMVKHVFPNAMVATLTYLPFLLNVAVTILTALDFLGFGLPPGSPSLGELLAQGKNNIQAPWLGLSGFATLAVMLTLLIFVGEAIRDAFDPRRALETVSDQR